jgi:hypothetical protein
MSATQSEQRSGRVATTGASVASHARFHARGATGGPVPVAAERPVFVADHPWRRRAANAVLALGALLLVVWLLAIVAGMIGFGGLPGLPLVPHGSSASSDPGSSVDRATSVGGVSRTNASAAQAASTGSGTPASAGTGRGATGNTPGTRPHTASQKVVGQPAGGRATQSPAVQGEAPTPAAMGVPTGREHSAGTAPTAPPERHENAPAGGAMQTVTPTGREIPQEPQGVTPSGAGAGEGTAGEAHRTFPQG